MKLELKNIELMAISRNLEEVSKEKCTLPITVSFKVVKNKIAVENALEAYKELHDEIITSKTGGKSEANKNDEGYEEIRQAIECIANEKSEVEIVTIHISELGDRELPLNLVAALGFMIEEG